MARSKNPKWLEPLWEKKKSETAKRVQGAVKELVKQNEPVTLDSIRHTVRALFGISISANTIRRNEGAYAAYQKHGTSLAPITHGYRCFAVHAPSDAGRMRGQSQGEDQPIASRTQGQPYCSVAPTRGGAQASI